MIHTPQLPPVANYVEVLYGGQRCYKNIQTGEIIRAEELPKVTQEQQLRADIDYLAAMLGVEL